MADFFQQEEEIKQEPEVEKIKIGDQEYDPSEAQKLIELGRIGREAEEKYHTDLTKVWPEYSRSQNELKETKGKLSTYEQELNQIKSQQQPATGDLTPEQIQVAKQQLQRIFGGDIVTRQDFENLYQERKAADSLLEEGRSLEKQIDGSDGRPPFKTQEILEHMRDTGIRNPMKAYKDLYEEQIDSWKEKQLTSKKTPFITNNAPTSMKQPRDVRPNKDNLNQLITDMLQNVEE